MQWSQKAKTSIDKLSPLNIFIIFIFFAIVAILQTNKRQLAYKTFEDLKHLRELREQKTWLEMKKAKDLRPERLDFRAKNLAMKKVTSEQVIFWSDHIEAPQAKAQK